jgi:hypothetical protein
MGSEASARVAEVGEAGKFTFLGASPMLKGLCVELGSL